MSEYEQQAQKFLKETNTKMTIEYDSYDLYFHDDKEPRAIYNVKMKRGKKSYSFQFGQSIFSSQNGEEPNAYDILSGLNGYDVGTFEDFCGDYGYDDLPLSKYPKVKKIYNAVCREHKAMQRLYDDQELEALHDIN